MSIQAITTDGAALLLAPHNDDETLFAAYTILRHAPNITVVTVFRSHLQELRGRGITAETREGETSAALARLGVPEENWQQWDHPDSGPLPEVSEALRRIITSGDWRIVYAPHPYPAGGHAQHDFVGNEARAYVEEGRLVEYHTYQFGRGRVQGIPVPVDDPDWIRRKLLALACYRSQINESSTGHHFEQALQEWYA